MPEAPFWMYGLHLANQQPPSQQSSSQQIQQLNQTQDPNVMETIQKLTDRVVFLEQQQTQTPTTNPQEVQDLKTKNQKLVDDNYRLRTENMDLQNALNPYLDNQHTEEEAREISRQIHEKNGIAFDEEKFRQSFANCHIARQRGFMWHTIQSVAEAVEKKVQQQEKPKDSNQQIGILSEDQKLEIIENVERKYNVPKNVLVRRKLLSKEFDRGNKNDYEFHVDRYFHVLTLSNEIKREAKELGTILRTDEAKEIAKEAIDTGKTVKELVEEYLQQEPENNSDEPEVNKPKYEQAQKEIREIAVNTGFNTDIVGISYYQDITKFTEDLAYTEGQLQEDVKKRARDHFEAAVKNYDLIRKEGK